MPGTKLRGAWCSDRVTRFPGVYVRGMYRGTVNRLTNFAARPSPTPPNTYDKDTLLLAINRTGLLPPSVIFKSTRSLAVCAPAVRDQNREIRSRAHFQPPSFSSRLFLPFVENILLPSSSSSSSSLPSKKKRFSRRAFFNCSIGKF